MQTNILATVVAGLCIFGVTRYTVVCLTRDSFEVETSHESQLLPCLLNWIAVNIKPTVNNVRLYEEAGPSKANRLLRTVHQTYSTMIAGNHVKYSEVKRPSVVIIVLDDVYREKSGKLPFFTPERLMEWIKAYGNRRFDHFMFIGKKKEMYKIWENPALSKLKWKWGIAIDLEEIFAPLSSTFQSSLAPAIFKKFKHLDGHVTRYHGALRIGHNVRGRHFRFTGWGGAPPYFFNISGHEKRNFEFEGSHYRVFNESRNYFNFTFEAHNSEGNGYGELLPNMTWTGMIGDLYYEERNFDALFYCTPMIHFEKMFDFSNAVTFIGIFFVTTIPGSRIEWQTFLRSFQLHVWLALAISWFLMGMVMYLSLQFSPYASSPPKTWFMSWLVPYKAAIEQTTKIPNGTKFLASVWLLAIVFTGTANKTDIISSLTLPIPVKLPSTTKQLAARTDYNVLLNNLGEIETSLFQTSELPVIQKLSKRVNYEPIGFDCLSRAILEKKTVCYAWYPTMLQSVAGRTTVDLNIDPYAISSESVFSGVLSVAFSKNSPYIDGFAPIISTFFESGIYDFWSGLIYRKQKLKGLENYKMSKDSPVNRKLKSITNELKGFSLRKPLRLEHLKMAFYILSIGLTLGCFVFVCEVTIFIVKMVINKRICDCPNPNLIVSVAEEAADDDKDIATQNTFIIHKDVKLNDYNSD